MTTLLIGVGLGVFVSALLLVAAFDLGQHAGRKRKHWPTQSRRGTTMQPYIQPQWDVTYHQPMTGERKTVRAGGESRDQAISEASQKIEGGAGWYFERAVRVA
ncbi:hypothetical protein [Burkholderia ubonensis]|uniref:hypothetical protein n=1 Tax=Burkholderia ubonensis TaxID=101571 RepID=UPI001160CC8D|nr:hypothetical protein [Burkholderia ubonensis]